MDTTTGPFCGQCGTKMTSTDGHCAGCGSPVHVAGTHDLLAPANRWRLMAFAGAALLGIGAFLPWAKVTAPFIGTVTRSGIDGGDGWVAVVLCGLAVAAAWKSSTAAAASRMRTKLFVLGVLAVLFTGFEFADIQSKFDEAKKEMDSDGGDFFGVEASDLVQTSHGVGIYAMGIGGLLIVGAAAQLRQTRD